MYNTGVELSGLSLIAVYLIPYGHLQWSWKDDAGLSAAVMKG